MIERLNSPNEDIEALLPWYEKGTLSDKDARIVEDYLASNPDRARFLALIREEMDETIEANERAGMPSRAAFDRLMDAVAAEPKPARRIVRERAGGLLARLFGQNASPWMIAGSAAAALVIMVQAAALGVLLMRDVPGSKGTPELAAGPQAQQSGPSANLLIRFSDNAKASDIAALLRSVNATIIDGPKSGGVYRLKLSGEKLTDERVEEILQQMRARSDIVALVSK